jgi:hypothetical protein
MVASTQRCCPAVIYNRRSGLRMRNTDEGEKAQADSADTSTGRRRHRVDDVLAVLWEIRHRRQTSGLASSITELRMESVRAVADQELAAGRFSNRVSAENSIGDACERRLGNIHRAEFDQLLENWLNGRPDDLRNALLAKATTESQRQRIAELLGRQDFEPALAEDLREIENRKIDSTMKDALVRARLGQGRFRQDVLKRWGNRCAVTGSQTCDAIRASHIKPWRDSTDDERLDAANGLPLVATLDALFDAGLISFEGSGRMVVSSELSSAERGIFAIVEASLAAAPSVNTSEYLAYHRENHFRG